ncbi:hypothetical protein ACLB6G_20385 [Zhengella sp. ZM62]|uniref:hypothetical protein n=1 Tax=Zhengella sedimenti TaxID=3390035 RepID=UPI003976CB65
MTVDPAELERWQNKAKKAEAEAIERRKALKAWDDLGMSPEEVAELKAMREQAEENKAKQAGEWDKLRAKLQDQHKTELERLRGELDAIAKSEHEARVQAGLLSAFADVGATEEGMKLLPKIYQANAKIETVDGKRVIRVLDADGSPMLGTSGADATLADLAAKAAEEYPSLFKSKVKAGSGTQPGGNGAGRTEARTVTRSQFDGMSHSERANFAREGGKVVDG